jgi:transcriptional regulator with XRE-family HTH domain
MAARDKKYPDMSDTEFAKMLGVTRLHVISVERGRRSPSADLVLRWLDALTPYATLAMFGDLPVVKERLRTLKRIEKVAPKAFAA